MELEWLGPYQIVGKLGRGGMGIVYEGVHRETGEPAAVKLLSAALAEEEGFRIRFEGEIETLRKLNHPNIVRLFGFGQQDGHLFYAMELVDGNSLEEELRRGRQFEWREAAQIGIQMCRALRHAHDRGIIHRDIKPANVLLAAEGHIKLSDFGIARLFGNTRMTLAGNVVGTAEYMSPEQAAGQPVDIRSDLYSLGALLYTLLARRPVFRGKSLPELLKKQQFEQPEPVRTHARDVPQEFEHILGELLEKNPAQRITNAGLLGRRLEAMCRALSIDRETVQADPSWFDGDETPPPAEASAASDESGVAATIDRPAGNVAATQMLPGTAQPGGANTAAGPKPAGMPAPSTSVPSDDRTRPFADRGTFVPVHRDELDPLESDEPRPALISWQTWALAGALVAVGMGVWWSLQPPSADTLYSRVQARVPNGSVDSLPRKGSEIDELQKIITDFLNRYPDNVHAPQLREYEKALHLRRLEWSFNQKLARRSGLDGLLPIEQLYEQALNDARSDPTVGVARLQALIDLYGESDDQPRQTEDCLSLARSN